MSINVERLSEKIFNLIRGYGYDVVSFDESGKEVFDPSQAIRFVVDSPNLLVRLDTSTETIMLSMKKDQDDLDEFRKSLKNLAERHLMNFDFKLFNKQLKPKSEKIDIAQKTETMEMANVTEGFGAMTGSTKTSYQPLDNVKIVVKHRKPVNEESRGARSRNIHSIYIQRGEERFRMAENNLKAARAMARHLNMGGEVHDSVGTAIVEMASEERKLKEFVRYVHSKKLVNEDNEQYVTLAKENASEIRKTMDRLAGVKTYANAVENLQNLANVEILEDDLDLEGQFTETHFDDKVANAMDSIKRSMNRQIRYRNAIEEAIAKEDFSNLKNNLQETEVMDFSTPHAKLGYQVSQMGYAAQNPTLKNHLMGISQKISNGERLGQFEYSTIKSCLLSASEAKVKNNSMYESAEQSYINYLEQFDIL